jgi:hypothetical protein
VKRGKHKTCFIINEKNRLTNHKHRGKMGMMSFDNNSKKQDDDDDTAPSFLSTDKAKVTFQKRNTIIMNNSNNSQLLSNTLSPMDRFLLIVTSDRTSLLLGSMGILFLLLNRLLTFPDEDIMYEASRSRIDLLGVFAAGSVLLNGITKLDVESVQAEKVVLEGRDAEEVIWDIGTTDEQQRQPEQQLLSQDWEDDTFQSIVKWALLSYLKCTSAKTAILLAKHASPQQGTGNNTPWMTLARVGTLPFDSQIPMKTPILDRMFSGENNNIKGGTVVGADISVAGKNKKGSLRESYLPTLQALPGKVEFTYLPSNAQEALILPVSYSVNSEKSRSSMSLAGGWHYAVVLGGDVSKSFAPRDIAWCKEIASWIGELV